MNLNEEVICGHLVTAEYKKLWNVELGCLEQLKKICQKHDIRYFAAAGTLLGAVRHQGFIPWDDDLDIVMMQNDYQKFCEVAPLELEAPYFFQSFQTQKGFGPFMSRIRNTNTTACTKWEYEHLAEGNHYGVFIDIFPMSAVPDPGIKLTLKKLLVKLLHAGVQGYELKNKLVSEGRYTVSSRLNKSIVLWNFIRLFGDHEKLAEWYIKCCGIGGKKSNNVGLISFFGFNDRFIFKREWFETTVSLPFEDTEILCPAKYDIVLRKEYGDYMVLKKGTAVHTMAVMDPDTPFTVKLKKQLSKEA